MTEPYPYADTGDRSAAEERFLSAEVVDYSDAEVDDVVAVVIGSITGAKYTASGTLAVTIDIPFDIIGNPTELMRSQGRMLVWQAHRLM